MRWLWVAMPIIGAALSCNDTKKREEAFAAQMHNNYDRQAAAVLSANAAAAEVARSIEEQKAAAAQQYASAKPAEREAAIRTCALGPDCKQALVDGIVQSGETDREREVLRRLVAAWSASVAARKGADGDAVSTGPVATATARLVDCGVTDLLKVDRTTVGKAAKDISAERGKVIVATGGVAEIFRDGALFYGTMSAASSIVRFVAVGSTENIVAGSWADFVGVLVQRYSYRALSGMQVEALLLAGRFRGQKDSDQPLPAAPATARPSRTTSPALSKTWDLPFPQPSARTQ